MPKKSKKKKILADIRRKHISIPQPLSSSFSLKLPENVLKEKLPNSTFSLPTQTHPRTLERSSNIKSGYQSVYKDLLKITIFSVLALLIQFVLVWILRTK